MAAPAIKAILTFKDVVHESTEWCRWRRPERYNPIHAPIAASSQQLDDGLERSGSPSGSIAPSSCFHVTKLTAASND